LNFLSTRLFRYLPNLWLQVRGNQLGDAQRPEDPDSPRPELFSASQIERHGKTLAGTHHLAQKPNPEQLLARLSQNESLLHEVHQLLTVAVTDQRRLTPAGEWLLDNFYLIEEQIRTAKRHLPKGYSIELPCLSQGPSAGLPRVYDIALETISHGDGRIDPESLEAFVAAYQTVKVLDLGELWAIPIMLRLALLENLRRVSHRIATDRRNRNQADYWADKISETAEQSPQDLILVIADMARAKPPMVSAFVAELTRRLQGRGPVLALPLTWMEQQLAASGLSIEQLIQSENQQQAADQLSLSNSIGSLRFLNAVDWRQFVEHVSVIEQVLGEDAEDLYSEMDFQTRDHYRQRVEKIARHSACSEREIAQLAQQMARQRRDKKDAPAREKHVGFYLIDAGRSELEKRAGVRHPWSETLQRLALRFPLSVYLGSLGLFTGLLLGILLGVSQQLGIVGLTLWLLSLLGLLAASQLAVSFTNILSALLLPPSVLPRLDFSKGIPPACLTLVVVPTLITSSDNLEALIEALEVRFLANRDAQLLFALLTDFCDASQETLPSDGPLLVLAQQQIEALNAKYPRAEGDHFFLFHRPRRFNPQEQVWMGYERKRGKIAELNALLRGSSNPYFSLIVGQTQSLNQIRYVITLDTDTQLPRDSAHKLVGAMAHPLNRPQYTAQKNAVTSGYGILQPRVAVSLPGTNRSRYARLWGSDAGIDPYSRAVSDHYQDLFREGSFIGKGIYELETFERTLKQSFPENRILSHDLIEGCYARAGLVSDVLLYEDYPAGYSSDVKRRHRWIRGDWQLLRWLWPGALGPERNQKNPLSLLSRWKIFDNLRRSLVPSALLCLFLLGWTLLPAPGWWSLTVLGVFLLPPLLTALLALGQKPDNVFWSQQLARIRDTLIQNLSQVALTLACLPYEAYFSLDAIGRTLWRMLISKKRLLEWRPSSEVEQQASQALGATFRSMWFAPALALSTGLYLLLARPMALIVALPVLGLWLSSPWLVWWISQVLQRPEPKLSGDQLSFLRQMARKTWHFFETFVGPEDHWLPPDNYQEHPVVRLAHRTSPTNMGMALLANLTAHDFGYLSTAQLLERTEQTLDSMSRLERHRGHFYNWYDTQSLQPLLPIYVSSVDSGNLAAHLLTLEAGLLALPEQKIWGTQLCAGLEDTLQILLKALADRHPGRFKQLRAHLQLSGLLQPESILGLRQGLLQLNSLAQASFEALDPDPQSQVSIWAAAFSWQCQSALDELIWLCPWTDPQLSSDFRDSLPGLDDVPSLRSLTQLEAALSERSNTRTEPFAESEALAWLQFRSAVSLSSQRAQQRIEQIAELAQHAASLVCSDYGFLYDESRQLLAIGYHVEENRRDSGYYDLLASEARLATFVGIAQGQLPQDSWFALGRLLTTTVGEPVLLSWSGSMFEYLMPLLVMPSYAQTLLDETYKASVARQISYGKQRGVPWGISESGYNTTDLQLNYQYSAFGVPGLGLKRFLAGDLVVAPYASALALMVAPEAACQNLEQMADQGFVGEHGFYEAIDYTLSRLPRGQNHAVVRSFMSHHQGMSLLALGALLLNQPMQRRFESNPAFQAVLLLLQERIPKATAFYAHSAELSEAPQMLLHEPAEMSIRVYTQPDTLTPEVQLLSNGRYHVMLTHTGGGYSRWQDLAVTRWQEDSTCDAWGPCCYLRDLSSGQFWSTTYQPTRQLAPYYEAIFSEGRAEFRRRDHALDSHTEIAVSPEDDIELRRITLTNRGSTTRTIEVTSYAEVVLNPAIEDALHPAFSKLFVQTEILTEQRAILCSRRPRSEPESPAWMFHLMAVHGADIGEVSYETDRMRFIGRGQTLENPAVMQPGAALSNTQGSVLDPIVSIRHCLQLAPEQSATINIVTGIGETRAACLELVAKYQDRQLADRVFDLAWTHSQVLLRQINATEADAQLYGRLAASVIYANASLRASSGTLRKNRRGQSGLWGYSISGDLPIVLLQIEDPAHIDLVRQLIQAHTYWRLKGLAVDLVIWNEDHAGYRQLLQEQIMGLIAAGTETHLRDRPGGIFVRSSDQISQEDRALFQAVARAILSDRKGTLAEQLSHRRPVTGVIPPKLSLRRQRLLDPQPDLAAKPREDLLFFNGLGGFTPDGREYVISTSRSQLTPAPWVNVLANAHFGSVVSENGMAYTWHENAHEFRLTPWHNDPVCDTSGEAFYLRDEDNGKFWSPMPLPCRGNTPYVTRHGFGYSVFEHSEQGLSTELWVYVALDAAVKFTVLRVKNQSGRSRRLSATGYVEWVLGDLRSKSMMHILTETDPASGAILAHNRYNPEFGSHTAFFHVNDPQRSLSADRSEFLGRNGSLATPAALLRTHLSGKVGTALDPCAALQVPFELADGEERELIFMLGAGQNIAEAQALLQRFQVAGTAHQALEAVWKHWQETLNQVQVQTPDPALNLLLNGWLLYQTLACRLWARSGYYQSGGAFGFRDQLQDVMALVHTRPQLVREHLLRCAARQFPEGDVQHWWHPPVGRGVRTRCSDDYLWLPLATCRYVRSTGDSEILDESVPFLKGRLLSPEEESYYDLPSRSEEHDSLYEHCVRAIVQGLRFGKHGLPLIGSGDWNDGMDRVGHAGQGESVWLAFFLCEVLTQFQALASARGDLAFALRCERETEVLKANIETHAWDGDWYLRAFFDDGRPLGSASNSECRIDAISQSWSVLSGAGELGRSQAAMKAVDQHLIRRQDALVQLLTPPFDTSDLNPGYIKGYVPGVRENGGQYTHSAIWTAMAFAALGDAPRAWEVLNLINPIHHGNSPEAVATYKVEPYVVAADVYGVAPHTGRGGWSWYTGSAAWMYRLMLESLLGLKREGKWLTLAPCLPPDWEHFSLQYHYGNTIYSIQVQVLPALDGREDIRVTLDGVAQDQVWIPLLDDTLEHLAEITLWRVRRAA